MDNIRGRVHLVRLGGKKVSTRAVSEDEFRAFDSIWEDRIPRGATTLVGGRPGGGKGIFAALVAAHVSKRSKVLFSAPENHRRGVIRPRLELAGAKLDHVRRPERHWRLPQDFKLIEAEIVRHRPRLLVIDPISRHTSILLGSGKIDEVANPLNVIAEKYDMAVLVTVHVRKDVSKNMHPLDAILGSGAGFGATAQQVYCVGKDPADQARHLLCCVKANALGDKEPFAFRRQSKLLTDDRKRTAEQAWLVAEGEADFYSVISLLLKPPEEQEEMSPELARASEFLIEFLYEKDGFAEAKEATEAAFADGINRRTLSRAQQTLGITRKNGCVVKEGDKWWWRLPEELKKEMDAEKEGEE